MLGFWSAWFEIVGFATGWLTSVHLQMEEPFSSVKHPLISHLRLILRCMLLSLSQCRMMLPTDILEFFQC